MKESNHVFFKRAKDWGFREFMQLDKLEDPSAGFLNEGTITIGVIETGTYPSEISWMLEDEDGNEVAAGGDADLETYCPNTLYPTAAPTTEPCADSCYGYTCDDWDANGNSCADMESQGGCDCSDCECLSDRTPPPTPADAAECYTLRMYDSLGDGWRDSDAEFLSKRVPVGLFYCAMSDHNSQTPRLRSQCLGRRSRRPTPCSRDAAR